MMQLFTSAAVDADVPMVLHQAPNDVGTISIMLGNEDITLDFFDVASLERLRDLAGEGAVRLRAEIETSAGEIEDAT